MLLFKNAIVAVILALGDAMCIYSLTLGMEKTLKFEIMFPLKLCKDKKLADRSSKSLYSVIWSNEIKTVSDLYLTASICPLI